MCAALGVDEVDAAHAPAAVAQRCLRGKVIGHRRARLLGVEHVLEHQAHVVRLTVDVGLAAGKARGAQVRRHPVELVRLEAAVVGGRAPEG